MSPVNWTLNFIIIIIIIYSHTWKYSTNKKRTCRVFDWRGPTNLTPNTFYLSALEVWTRHVTSDKVQFCPKMPHFAHEIAKIFRGWYRRTPLRKGTQPSTAEYRARVCKRPPFVITPIWPLLSNTCRGRSAFSSAYIGRFTIRDDSMTSVWVRGGMRGRH